MESPQQDSIDLRADAACVPVLEDRVVVSTVSSFLQAAPSSPHRMSTASVGIVLPPRGILRNYSMSVSSSGQATSSPLPRCASASTSTAASTISTDSDKRMCSASKRCVTFSEEPHVHEYELPSDESIRSHSIHELRQREDSDDLEATADTVDACTNGSAATTSSKRRGLLRKVERKSKTKVQQSKYDYKKWVAGLSSPRPPISATHCPPASPSSPRAPSTAAQTSARNVAPGSRRASRLMMAALSGAASITGAPTIGPNAIAAWRRPLERTCALPASPSTYRPSTTLSSPTRVVMQDSSIQLLNARPVPEPASPLPTVSHSAAEKASIAKPDALMSNTAANMTSPDRCESPAASSPSERGDFALAFLRRRKMAKQKEREAPSAVASLGDLPASDQADEDAEARRSEMRLRETILDSYPRLPQLDAEEVEETDEVYESSSESDDDDEQNLGVDVNLSFSSQSSNAADACPSTAQQVVVPEESRDVLPPVLQVDLSARLLETTIDLSLTMATGPSPASGSSRPIDNSTVCTGVSGTACRPVSPSSCLLEAPPFILLSEDANRSSLSGIHDSPHRHVTSVLQLLASPDKVLDPISPGAMAMSEGSPARCQTFAAGDRVAVSFGKIVYHGIVTQIRDLQQEAFIKYDDFPVSRGEWKSWDILAHLAGTGRQLRNRDLPAGASPQSARKRPRDAAASEACLGTGIPRRISLTSVFEAEPLT